VNNFICTSKFELLYNFKFQDTIDSITDDIINNWECIEHVQNRTHDVYNDANIIYNCRVCENITNELLNLNTQPLANRYHTYNNILKEYPLCLHYCPVCFHVQLNCDIHIDYFETNHNNVDEMVDNIINIHQNTIGYKSKLKVLNIACKNSVLLDIFKSGIECITVGVELVKKELTKSKTHDIYYEFSMETVEKLKLKYGFFDIIISQNIIADPTEFLSLCKELMNNTSNLFIQTNHILNNEFEVVYHEHLNCFNTNSMRILCTKNNLYLNNVMNDTSYLFQIGRCQLKQSNTEYVLLNEKEYGLYKEETYVNYKFRAIRYKNEFQNKLIDYKINDKLIIGFGSTIKSNTLLNFCNITNSYINYIIDENRLKQNLLTPGSNIIITPFELKIFKKDIVILILNWKFYDDIKCKLINKIRDLKIDFPITILNIHTLQEEII
jgi:hypothetical protein